MTSTEGAQPRRRRTSVRTGILVIILAVLCSYALSFVCKVHEVRVSSLPDYIPHLPELLGYEERSTTATTSGSNNNNAIGSSPMSSSNARAILDRLAENAAIQSAERDSWFDAARAHHVRHRKENEKLAALDLSTFYGGIMLQPSSTCPADLMKTSSVRDVFDGGKWLCGASLLGNASASASAHGDRPCVVYSLGCNFETSFERTVQQISGGRCEVHVYDPTLGPPDRVRAFAEEMERERIYLHEVAVRGTSGHSRIRIGDREYESQGIGTMFETNGHDCVDILKFDVEGAEYDILEDTDWCELFGMRDELRFKVSYFFSCTTRVPRPYKLTCSPSYPSCGLRSLHCCPFLITTTYTSTASLCIGMVLFELHGGMIRDQRGVDYTVKDGIRHVRRLEEAGFQHYKTEQVWVGGHAQAELAFVNYTWLLPALEGV